MKTLFILMISCTFLSVNAQTQKTHSLDLEKSVVNWEGNYAFNFSKHEGTVHFKQGELITSDGRITGGSFTIDMTTISNEEYEAGVGAVEHLRSDDFFDVSKFPEAKMVFTSVEYFPNTNTHEIFADFTIKEITKSVKFYAEVDGEKRIFKTKFIIDRTDWGITYNHKLKDQAIADAIPFYVTLEFQKEVE